MPYRAAGPGIIGLKLSEVLLEREIDLTSELIIAYFGINPSTADAQQDDSTVRKWIGFTRVNTGRRFIVGNVFGYRATNVSELTEIDDPVGPDNESHLNAIIAEADILVPCWGSRNKLPKSLHEQLTMTMNLIQQSGKSVMVFGLTEGGDPKHPLMLSYDTKLVHF